MSQATVGALRVVLGLDSAAFTDGLSAAQKHLRGVGRQMQAVGATMATVGAGMTAAITAPLIAAGFAASKAATEAADAMGQVEAALASMGDASGKTKEELAGLAEGLMRSSLYDDDDILRSVTANLLTFGNVAGAEFDRAQQAAVDLATRMKMDLQPATIMIGKALQNPIRGLTALRKAGLEVEPAQEAMIRSLVAAGDVAGAQAIILSELERQVRGSAAAAQNTDPYDKFRDSLNSLSESIGVILNTHLTPLLDRVAGLADRFNTLSPAMQQMVVAGLALAAALGPVLVAVGAVVGAVGTLIASPFLPFLAGAAVAAVAVGTAFAVWGKDLIPIVREFGEALVEAIGPMIPPMVAAMKAAFQAMAPVVKFVGEALIGAFGPIVITALRTLAAVVTGTFNIIGQAFRVVGALIRGDFTGAWNAVGSLVVDIVKSLGRIVEAVFPGITGVVGRMVQGVTSWLAGKLFDVLRDVIRRVGFVSDAFFKLYDAVVGNSYVPDMVDGIAHHMARLQSVMVDPITRATAIGAARFEKMGDDVRAVIEGLLTDRERLDMAFASDTAALDAARKSGGMTQADYDLFSRRNRDRYASDRAALPNPLRDAMDSVAGAANGGMATVGEQLAKVSGQVADQFGVAADSIRTAFDGAKGAADDFASAFADNMERVLRGDFAGILNDLLSGFLRQMLLNLGKSIGNWGLQQGGGIGAFFGSLMGFKDGGSFTVGGSGGIDSQVMAFRATPGEMVDIRKPGQDRGGALAVHVTPSPYFDVQVQKIAGPVAQAAAGQMGRQVLDASRRAAPGLQQRQARLGST